MRFAVIRITSDIPWPLAVFITVLALLIGFSLQSPLPVWHNQSDVIVSGVNTEEKIIALTFDDGPDPVQTPDLLKTLNTYHAKATFFVLGANADLYPLILRDIIHSGNQVGNHGYNHISYRTNSYEEISQDMKMAEDTIYRIAGIKPMVIRPPGGGSSTALMRIARENNYRIISWAQDPEDWNHKTAEEIARSIMKDVHPGSIIVLHDGGGNRRQTILAVEQVLPKLKQSGYKFVTVEELLK